MKYGHRNKGEKQPEVSNLDTSQVEIRKTIASRDLAKPGPTKGMYKRGKAYK